MTENISFSYLVTIIFHKKYSIAKDFNFTKLFILANASTDTSILQKNKISLATKFP